MATANAPARTQPKKTPSLVDPENGGIQITNAEQMFTVASNFANSDMVPKDYRGKPGNIMVAWQKGYELGLKPMQALDGIAVINGRATLWGETTTAIILASGLLIAHKSWHTGSIKEGNLTAHYKVHRKGMAEANEYTFSMEDAQMAGLWGKGTYSQYPKDMLMWKAKARAYRTDFADCLKGTMVREDMEGGLRRRVDNTAVDPIAERTPPVDSDPLLDEFDQQDERQGDVQTVSDEPVQAEFVDAEYEEQRDDNDGVDDAAWEDDQASEPEPEPQPITWIAAVDALKAKTDCDTDTAEQIIADAVAKKWKKDVNDLTLKQIELLITAIEEGKITA